MRSEEKQKVKDEVMTFVTNFKAQYDGLSPSYRHMSKEMGYSIGKIQRAILDLIEDGLLRQGPRGGLMVKPFNGWSQ